MKTITGIEIKVSENTSKRTFTIRKNGFKYRTFKMNKEEFNSARFHTANDWQNYLTYSSDYYSVK